MKDQTKVSNSFILYANKIGHKVLFRTRLFDKDYVWMKDSDGTIYLEHLF